MNHKINEKAEKYVKEHIEFLNSIVRNGRPGTPQYYTEWSLRGAFLSGYHQGLKEMASLVADKSAQTCGNGYLFADELMKDWEDKYKDEQLRR